jgi:hypothetical protein
MDISQKHNGKPRLSMIAAGLLACLGATEASADLSVFGGGGWSGPRGDSAAYVANGLTGHAGLEVEMGQNLSFALAGAYTGFGAKSGKLKSDLGLPPTDPLDAHTSIIEVSLTPKLYVTKRDIAAYVAFGGGPRWITHTTKASVTGMETTRDEQAWGVVAGFGLDLAMEGFRVGFAPTYHRINAERRPIEYMTFVFYLKL